MHILSSRGLASSRVAARSGRGPGGHFAARGAALLAACALVAACGGGGGDRGAASAAAGSGTARSSAPMVVVPRLVGREQEEAHRVAARAGLQLRWTGFTGKLGNGRYNVSCVKILSQSPVAGERRARGTKIAVIEAACHTPNERPHGVAPDGSTEG